MNLIGGYIMVDFEGLDVTTGSTSVTVTGLYDRMVTAIKTHKTIKAYNLTSGAGGDPHTPADVSAIVDNGAIVIFCDTIRITVTSEDAVTTMDLTGQTPAAPTNLTASATEAGVVLSWTASAGARNYRVSRRKGSGAYFPVDLNVLTNEYTDTDELEAGTYGYVVSAQNGFGTSAGTTVTVTIE